MITPDTTFKTSVENIYDKIDLIRLQFDEAREKSKTSVVELNLFVFVSGHFDEQGNFLTRGSEKLFGNDFLDKLKQLKADNILMFLMGCYSEGFFNDNRQTLHRSQTLPSKVPSDVNDGSNVIMRRLRRTFSPILSGTNNREFVQECVAGESHNKTVSVRKHSDIALNNFVAYCSSPAQEKSFFKRPNQGNREKVNPSLFTMYLINALRGAQECSSLLNEGVDGKINASGCPACFPLRKTLGQWKVVEVNDVVSYIRAHMKLNIKDEKCLPRLLVSGDGRKIYLIFATEEGQN